MGETDWVLEDAFLIIHNIPVGLGQGTVGWSKGQQNNMEMRRPCAKAEMRGWFHQRIPEFILNAAGCFESI